MEEWFFRGFVFGHEVTRAERGWSMVPHAMETLRLQEERRGVGRAARWAHIAAMALSEGISLRVEELRGSCLLSFARSGEGELSCRRTCATVGAHS